MPSTSNCPRWGSAWQSAQARPSARRQGRAPSSELGGEPSAADVEAEDLELIAAVREAVKLPLAVKLSPYYSALANFADRVVDAGANLKAFVRQDGAWLGSVDIAIKKAKTARFFDMNTGDIGGLSQPGGPLYQIEVSNGGLITFPGGVPLRSPDGTVIGAIGVSGSTVEDDHAEQRGHHAGQNQFAPDHWAGSFCSGAGSVGSAAGGLAPSGRGDSGGGPAAGGHRPPAGQSGRVYDAHRQPAQRDPGRTAWRNGVGTVPGNGRGGA